MIKPPKQNTVYFGFNKKFESETEFIDESID